IIAPTASAKANFPMCPILRIDDAYVQVPSALLKRPAVYDYPVGSGLERRVEEASWAAVSDVASVHDLEPRAIHALPEAHDRRRDAPFHVHHDALGFLQDQPEDLIGRAAFRKIRDV